MSAEYAALVKKPAVPKPRLFQSAKPISSFCWGVEKMLEPQKDENITIAINEAQLILAEKRTSLSVMRTGIAVLAMPLSVLSVLVATSKYYNVLSVLHILVPLAILIVFLTGLGLYLIIRAMIRMRHYDHLIRKIKLKHSIVADFID